MLFSDETIADMVNEQFEPVWVSLREVPRVTIDFGNGNVVRRTLHGNIATWICDSDGTAMDVLPGVYEPQSYLLNLQYAAVQHRQFAELDSANKRREWLAAYHQVGLRLAEENQNASTPYSSGRSPLENDTLVNEFVRRKQIHQYLETCGIIRPGDATRWLYREVLNADLDDPYLGLGETLFGSYPFALLKRTRASRADPDMQKPSVCLIFAAIVVLFCCNGCQPANSGEADRAKATAREQTQSGSVVIRDLQGRTIISHADIVAYTWDSHVVTLRQGLRQRLHDEFGSNLIGGVGFVLVADGVECYTGEFKSSLSSFSSESIVIDLFPSPSLTDDQIQISIGYPTSEFFEGTDERGHDAIRNALSSLEKLR